MGDYLLPQQKQPAFDRQFRARWQAMEAAQERKIREREQLERSAQLLLAAGTVLIPSDDLLDNEYVVSRKVFEAAKDIVKDT